MGDRYQKIAAPQVAADAAGPTAQRVVAWLVDRRIIGRETTACVLGAPEGYPPGAGVAAAVDGAATDNWRTLLTNGVEVITEWTVFWNLEPATESRCPACGRDNGPDFFETTVFAGLAAWHRGDGDLTIRCGLCGASSPLRRWHFDPVWAFADFGLTFWNWPRLTDRFLEDLSAVIRAPVIYQAGKL